VHGVGVRRSYKHAFPLFLRSARQGYPLAQYEVAVCLRKGHGTKKNVPEALRWYSRAARQGDADAQEMLGWHYFYGDDGVRTDHKEAVSWYRRAARKGNPGAQYALATCYENGDGVRKNRRLAILWYSKAAEQGYADAKVALAD